MDRALENEKKPGKREKGGPHDRARKSRGITRSRQESERRWHVVGLEAFTRNISLTKNIQAAS